MIRGAMFDSSGTYRYTLWRRWNAELPRVLFIMLNPSTADGEGDDPTIRRCIQFARSWGCGSLVVVNLFAFRATNPGELRRAHDPVGPENDAYIVREAGKADKIVVAWGIMGGYLGRDREVYSLLAKARLECLHLSKAGHPMHPLYIAADCNPIPYPGP